MHVRYALDAPVATLTLASPETRNALSLPMLRELEDGVVRASTDDGVRVVVLTGQGSAFCAGADLVELGRAYSDGDTAPWTAALVSALRTLWLCPKPVVARVNGATRAGGIGLLAGCDLGIACESATFGLPEVRLGTVPAVIAVLLFRRLSYARALEYCLTGDVFGAAEAREAGLITRVVPDGELDRETRRCVESLLLGGARALATTKAIARSLPGKPLAEAFAEMEHLSAELFEWPEAQEGMAAFRDRRRLLAD